MRRVFTTERVVLLMVLTLAAALRLHGLSFGLPFAHARPDETAVAGPAVLCLIGQCRPVDFIYPTGFIYVLTLAYLGVFLVRWVAGVSPDLTSFAESRRVDLAPFFLTSRAISAIVGIATVYWVDRIGRLLWSPAAGLVSAGYLAVSLLHVRDSHFGTLDVTMTGLIVLATLYVLRWQQTPRHGLAIAAGLVGGAATSTKYNGLGVALPFLVAAASLLAVPRPTRRVRPSTVAIAAALAAAAGVVAFLALTPFVLVEAERFLRDVTARGDGLAQPHGIDVGSGWRHHALVTLPAAFGWPLYLWSVAGALGLLLTRVRASLVLLSFPVAYFIVIGTLETVFARYALPLLPFLALTAGWLTVAVGRWLGARFPAVPASAVTVLLAVGLATPSLHQAILLDRVLARPDTRVLAAQFLLQHASPGQTIHLSGRDYGHVPLTLGTARTGLEVLVPDAAGMFAPDASGEARLPDWLVLQRSPLTLYSHVPPHLEHLAASRYRRVAMLQATDAGHAGLYDQQDALYLPLWGLEGVRLPGPSLEILRRR